MDPWREAYCGRFSQAPMGIKTHQRWYRKKFKIIGEKDCGLDEIEIEDGVEIEVFLSFESGSKLIISNELSVSPL